MNGSFRRKDFFVQLEVKDEVLWVIDNYGKCVRIQLKIDVIWGKFF